MSFRVLHRDNKNSKALIKYHTIKMGKKTKYNKNIIRQVRKIFIYDDTAVSNNVFSPDLKAPTG